MLCCTVLGGEVVSSAELADSAWRQLVERYMWRTALGGACGMLRCAVLC